MCTGGWRPSSAATPGDSSAKGESIYLPCQIHVLLSLLSCSLLMLLSSLMFLSLSLIYCLLYSFDSAGFGSRLKMPFVARRKKAACRARCPRAPVSGAGVFALRLGGLSNLLYLLRATLPLVLWALASAVLNHRTAAPPTSGRVASQIWYLKSPMGIPPRTLTVLASAAQTCRVAAPPVRGR